MIITIDGLDGAGKSTLAKGLAKELNFEYVDKPLYELFSVKGDDNYLYDQIYHLQDLIYNKTNSNTLKSWFTGMSLLYIKECMQEKNIIIDRGLLSAYAFNGDNRSLPVFDLLINLGVWFDLSILVTVSNEERLRRIKARNINDPDLSLNKILELRYDSIKSFLLLHPELPTLIIDTDNKSPNEILTIAMNGIEKRKKEINNPSKTRKKFYKNIN